MNRSRFGPASVENRDVGIAEGVAERRIHRGDRPAVAQVEGKSAGLGGTQSLARAATLVEPIEPARRQTKANPLAREGEGNRGCPAPCTG